ncbi:MAG TPA: vitamin B12 receptor [Marinilabiliales bacterium]|nr:vitamin B12 receptor [Marinilabiliales bacterium]HBX85572.1 vitamin B12 receptor [Marinilabiliales bacterium]HBY55111.1 vitamin B12 receptor [Marinilabiliales bacterium]
MMNLQSGYRTQPPLVFNRWSRKPYAIFRSLNRVINIGVLTGTLTLLAAPEKGYAQTDTITINNHQEIDEVLISSNRTPKVYREAARIVTILPKAEIQAAPTSNLQDLLKYVASVDIRQRGAQGVQADVSIRGGSNEQILILLNGIPMNDPQTGHHNLNLPLDLSNIERIEILQGPGSRIYGPNALSGAINIITNPQTKQNLTLSTTGGQFGFYQGTISTQFQLKSTCHFLSASTTSSDGYIRNTDFKNHNLFYHGGWDSHLGRFDWQWGYLNKAFGANSFYTAVYPDQFEQVRNNFTSLSFKNQNRPINFQAQIYWKRNHDRFELFREDDYQYRNGYFIKDENDTAKYAPGSYYPGHNYHMTDILGASANTSFQSKLGTTSLGVDYRFEHIYSNKLGTLTDTINAPGETRGKLFKEDSRKYADVYAEQSYKYKKFDVSAGMLVHFNNQYHWFVNGGGEVGYRLNPQMKTYISINQSMRMPTFTDLYYDGPTNKGNPDLKPETAMTYEWGHKASNSRLRVNGAIFFRDTKNAIDWVKDTSETKYTTLNYTRLLTGGFELAAQLNSTGWKPMERLFETISCSYTFLNTSKNIPDTIDSYYSLDFLKHKLNVSGNHRVVAALGFSWSFTFYNRNGGYPDINNQQINYKTYSLFDMKLFWTKPNYELYLEGQNLFNTKYDDLGGITQPGTWIKAGLKWRFS